MEVIPIKMLIYMILSRIIYTTYGGRGMYDEEKFFNETIRNDTFSSPYDNILNENNSTYDHLIDQGILSEVPNNDNFKFSELKNVNTFTSNFQNSFIKFDQPINYEKIDETSINSIVDYLDNMDTDFIPEELNNSELQVLNLKEVNEFFESKQSITIMNSLNSYINKDNLNNNLQLESINVIVDFTYDINFTDEYNKKSIKYMPKAKKAIVMFINHRLGKSYREFYIQRLGKIEKAFNNFKYLKSISLKFCCDSELLETLNRLYSNFRNIKIFNEITRETFSRNFDSEILKKKNAILFKNVFGLPEEYGMFNFYFEMMKLHKYINEIPELLILWKLFIDRSYCDISFVLHLINLFVENIGNPKDNRRFILCMIHKIFSMSFSKYLDFFLPSTYHFKCHKEHLSNIYFFLWEIQSSKRIDIKRRMGERKFLKYSHVEIIHLKTIFLIHLYQHMEFLIYYNFNVEVIENFIQFFMKVLNLNNCLVCFFDEFLGIARNHINTLI